MLRFSPRNQYGCRVQNQLIPCLSVVVPCFNEEATVAQLCKAVLDSPVVAELIVVDDGSTDETPLVLRSISDPRVTVLTHEENRGKGAALKTGFAAARSEYVIVQDADLEYDPAEFVTLLGPLIEGTADVVYGSRFSGGSNRRVMSFWHATGNRVLTVFSNMLTNLNLTDMETCYKAFRRSVLDQIVVEEERFGFEPEITAKLAQLDVPIYEIGISYRGRSFADGKKIGWRDGIQAVFCIVAYSPIGERFHLKRHSPLIGRLVGRHVRRRFTSDTVIADDALIDTTLGSTLEALDGAQNYLRWILSFGGRDLAAPILEIGAGHGTFTSVLAEVGHTHAVEPSELGTRNLHDRYGNDSRVTIHASTLEDVDLPEAAGSAVMINVLEHIEDDAGALRATCAHLREGGSLFLWVPAFESLYSPFDRRLGHYRRYRRPQLVSLVEDCGFEVTDSTYVNLPGWFAWLVFMRLFRSEPSNPKMLRLVDRFAVPFTRSIEQRCRPPFGQSIAVVARRPIGDDGSH